MGEHAILSASGSKMWLNCPPSARLNEQYPDVTSEYAAEGTLAHAICEQKLLKTFTVMTQRLYTDRLRKLKKDKLYKEEMMATTDVYHDLIYQICVGHKNPKVLIEQKLDYSNYAPEGFGTGDCTIIGGDTLYVIDYKHGKGVPVSAEENTQMMLYALGAYTKWLNEYSFIALEPIRKVKMIIVQPRLEPQISEWEAPIEGILAWGESIKPIAQMAFNGEGTLAAGEHCRWCKARATCGTRANKYLELDGFQKALPPMLSNDSVGLILEKAIGLAAWVKDLEEYALKESLRGGVIAGWKVVEGRSNRRFTDVDGAFAAIKASGVDEAVLYNRVPITLTDTETLLGKPKFKELLEGYVVKPQGKPTLVQASDKRMAYVRNGNAEEEFTNLTEE